MAITKHWPIAAVLAVLAAVLAACLVCSLARTEGHFAYVLDDPYIHMAVAKNLSLHGVFGTTRYGYSSSTSSMLWPLLLWGVYWVAGPGVIAPWVINVLLSAAALWLIYELYRRRGVAPGLNFVFLLIVFFATPMPAIIFTGLEHSLHVLLAVACVHLAGTVLSQRPEASGAAGAAGGRHWKLLLATAPLLVMTRYEGAFMVAVVCLLLAVRRRVGRAAAMAALGAAPVVIGGLVSMAHGWHFLPNPVLLKGRIAAPTLLGRKALWLIHSPAAMLGPGMLAAGMLAAGIVLLGLLAVYAHRRRLAAAGPPAARTVPTLGPALAAAMAAVMGIDIAQSWGAITAGAWKDPHWDLRWSYVHEIYLVPAGLLAVVLLLALSYRRGGRRLTAEGAMLWVVLGTALLHLGLARRGWFWRYEAYLVAVGLFVALPVACREFFLGGTRPAVFRRGLAWCIAAGVLAVPFAVRGVRSVTEIPRAAMNVYDQQYQMASFLDEHYTGRGIAANDVGAVNYYADVRCLDLWGLSSLEVADARLQGNLGPQEIHAMCRRNSIDVAVVFDKWCQDEFGGVPPEWHKVGQWQIVDNLVCGWHTVSFYALNDREKDALAENLADYSRKLPARVIQRGSYVQ